MFFFQKKCWRFEYSNAPVDFRDKILKIAFTGGLRKQEMEWSVFWRVLK